MFNDDQKDWMRTLSALPLEAKCGCGWDYLGACYNCRQTAARVRGVTSRSEDMNRRTFYKLPGGPAKPAVEVEWEGLAAWLKENVPTCFGVPVPHGDGVYHPATPWAVVKEPCARCGCPHVIGRPFHAYGLAPAADDRIMLWCRTCGTCGSAGRKLLESPATPTTPTTPTESSDAPPPDR